MPVTQYATLGVEESVSAAELKAAYKVRALSAHPDKGGDVETFDRLQKAFVALEDPGSRERYDASLAKERAKVVERPEREDEAEEKPKPTVARVKTAPTPGSKNSARKAWKSPYSVLKAIEDGASEEQKAERIFAQYSSFDQRAGKEKLRKWTKKLLVKDQQLLKQAAKVHADEAKKKAAKWLAGPTPKEPKPVNPFPKARPAAEPRAPSVECH
jgi:curved DNA-binding protein CbpA